MSRLSILLLCAFAFQYCQAQCDTKQINDIKNIRQNEDDSNILDSLPGEYSLVYVSMGPLTPLLTSQCFNATIIKGDSGARVVYKNEAVLFNLEFEYKDEAFQSVAVNGETPYTGYLVYKDVNVIAVYSCVKKGQFSMPVSMIAVRTSALQNPGNSIEEAIGKFHSVEINGLAKTPCTP